MERLTTDNPTTNVEAMLNFAYCGEDGRVKLRYADGEENVDLCEYIANNACCQEVDAAAVMDGACLECDCRTSILNTVAIQAAELRARLKRYEDAEPVRHGRWESFDDNSWRCSECRRENCYAYDEISQRFTDFYCPNCGAKMDKEG